MKDNYPESTATHEFNEYDYSCGICGKTFNSRDAAKTHYNDTSDGEHRGDPYIIQSLEDEEASHKGHYTNWE